MRDKAGHQVFSTLLTIVCSLFFISYQPKITHIPDWVRVAILKIVRVFTGSKIYGPVEFFLTVMAIDMLAPEYGKHSLNEYFANLNDMNV
ncbi:hypothetical protein QUF70_04610 [Desulfobacterales bacterium HSG17]|nr:hypothetical protein [Desulfobacterales bacterium HSG17]